MSASKSLPRYSLAHRLCLTTAVLGFAVGSSVFTAAQVTVTDGRTTTIRTSTAGTDGDPSDVTVTSDGSITVTGTDPAAVLDSDNVLTIDGGILIEDVDNSTAVEIVGGNTGSFVLNGIVSNSDTTEFTDTDDDNVIDGPFANGSGRTGILISGASPFVGNIEMTSTAGLGVEGENSFGIRLMDTAGLTGDMILDGSIEIVGANSVGVGIEGQIIGNLANAANISARGEGVQAVNISGDIDGSFTNNANIQNTGYRFTNRPNLRGRELLGDEDRRQAGNALSFSSNITGGIGLLQTEETTTADDGTETTTITGRSNIGQFGGAAAILIDGQGTPIAIGRVSAITDPDAEGYDADRLYAFVNEGDIISSGIYDDVGTAVLEIRDAVLEGGIRNSGTMSATSYRSGDDGTADVDGFDGTSRIIILGNGAVADEINNSGIIRAQVLEATDEIYADTANPIAARLVQVVAIDIEEGASLETLINTNIIAATATARDAVTFAIRDASGTLNTITNSGQIIATALNSDSAGTADTSFTNVALDLAANTSGVTITQIAAIDSDPDDGIDPLNPNIIGDIRLGSGDDVINVSAGGVAGDISFGGGNDSLTLSGNSFYTGGITSNGSELTLSVTDGSILTNTNSDSLDVADATFDGTSAYRPTLDGATGNAGTLNASGTVTFADGASIAPLLTNIIGTDNTVFRVADANSLVIEGDIGSLSGVASPFLYNTTYSIDPNDPNALLITLDLRDTNELGLDGVQTAAFTSAFAALGANAALGDAFVNISDGDEFNQAFNQLLPEFSAAARQFVIANVDGATGAVAAHLDNVRRSQDRPGGAWIQEFAYFADRDLAGLSEQYRGNGFGFTAGLDTAWGPFHAVGINAGFASTEIESVADQDDPLDVLTIQLGTYAAYQSGKLGIEALAGVGFNDFESERNVLVGDFIGASEGDWSGIHYNGTLRAGYDMALTEKIWMRPTVSLDYISLNEKAYTETGDLGVALDIDSRTSESGSATAMLNVGAKYMGRRTWIRPSVRVGYRNEFIGDGTFTSGRFAGMNTPFAIESEEFPGSGFLLGFSFAAGSQYSSFSFDIDSDIRDGFVRHTGRIVLRLLF
ncbi:autotransporter domain-containing protein [Fretibacter rubidus]|uniref:autotransporter family protein n=1 Tax=Fretibacter rubidus TaxID=570162 RepID=UPI00352B92B2